MPVTRDGIAELVLRTANGFLNAYARQGRARPDRRSHWPRIACRAPSRDPLQAPPISVARSLSEQSVGDPERF